MMSIIRKTLKLSGIGILSCLSLSVVYIFVGLQLPFNQLSAGSSSHQTLIKNTNIVNILDGTTSANKNILLENGYITKITSNSIQVNNDTVVIDGSRQYVMPGLWDMHTHFIHHSPEIHFPLLISHGITHVREMGFGSPMDNTDEKNILMTPQNLKDWRRLISEGEMVGPNIESSAVYQIEEFGDIWEHDDLLPPEERISKLFASLKVQGVDFIKITLENNPPKEFFYRIMNAANKTGLPVVGHKPRRVSAIEASNLGLKTMEHARFLVVESSSLRETYLSGSFDKSLDKKLLYKQMIESYDRNLAEQTFQAFNSNDTWYTPTHLTRRWEANYDNNDYLLDERIETIPYLLRAIWKLDAFLMSLNVPSSVLNEFYEQGLKITGHAYEAGVNILAGSDALDPYAFYGSGLVEELIELTKAGIPNDKVLRIATYDAASFVNKHSKFGTVEEGKAADLLILKKDPLQSINNLNSISTVITQGHIYKQTDLNKMKLKVSETATSWSFTSRQLWLLLSSLF